MKLPLTLVFCTGLFAQAVAQQTDSLKINKPLLKADPFPVKRNFDVRLEQFGPGSYSPEFMDQRKGEGRLSANYRVKTTFNLPVYKTKTWNVSATVKHKYEVYAFESFRKDDHAQNTIPHADKIEYHVFSGAVNVGGSTTLFKKRLLYSASIIADASDKEFGRIKGQAQAILLLKQTPQTSFGLGLTGFVDASAQYPVLPVISWQHTLKNRSWAIDAVIPQRLFIRKTVSPKSRISLGSELENELLYMSLNSQQFQGVYDYRQFELKSGLVYEYALGKDLIATGRAGIRNIIVSRGVEKGKAAGDYIYSAGQEATGYFAFGLSFSPFK